MSIETDIYQQIVRENKELSKALGETREILNQKASENSSMMQTFDVYKHNQEKTIEYLSQELGKAQKGFQEEKLERKESKEKYEIEKMRFKNDILKRQKEIEELHGMTQGQVDITVLTMKARKEVEVSHRNEIEDKQHMIDELQREKDQVKRNLVIVTSDFDSLKRDTEMDQTNLKSRYKEDIDSVLKENESLNGQIERSREREQLRIAKKDLEGSKRRVQEFQEEVYQLRRERDEAKDQRADLIISNTKEIEEERTKARQLVQESDTLKFKIKCIEDDLQSALLEKDKQTKTIETMKAEKLSLCNQMRERELMNDSLRVMMNEKSQEIKDRNSEIQQMLSNQHRLSNIDQEQGRIKKLQSQYEILDKNYKCLENQRKSELEASYSEYEKLQSEHRILLEERKITMSQL